MERASDPFLSIGACCTKAIRWRDAFRPSSRLSRLEPLLRNRLLAEIDRDNGMRGAVLTQPWDFPERSRNVTIWALQFG